jgi:hypothetical protein
VRTFRSRHRDALVAASVRVLTRNGSGDQVSVGTGFFVSDGWVLTCAHVVPADAGNTYAIVYDGEEREALLLERLTDAVEGSIYAWPDVALLEVNAKGHACAPLGTADPAENSELYAYGCPLLDGVPFWEGIGLFTEGPRTPAGTTKTYVKTRGGQVQPGASGAGVIDVDSGLVIGLLTITRNPEWDAGGVLVPITAVVDALSETRSDLRERNGAATEGLNGYEAVKHRMAHLLQSIENIVADVNDTHLRAMLAYLEDAVPAALEKRDAALALLNLELDDLGRALEELARAQRSAEDALCLLLRAAPASWLDHLPWIPPDGAALLATERRRPDPRVVQIAAAWPRSTEFYVSRAAVDGHWESIQLPPPDAELDEETGLPLQLVRSIRCELLRRITRVDPEDAERIDALWQQKSQDALARAKDRLLVLPSEVQDAQALIALRTAFEPCLFAVATRELPPGLHGWPRLLPLPAVLDEEAETGAEERLRDIMYQIEIAVET